MNEGLPHDHASIAYYDGDYPWRGDPRAPSNFDEIVVHQGLAFDIDFYLQLAGRVVARDVDQRVALVDDPSAPPYEAVDHPEHGVLVAGNE